MAFLLLAGAGLLIQTIGQLRGVDLGFEPGRILTGRIALLRTKYDTDERIRGFYREAIERLRTIPGVLDAGFTSNLPYQTMGNTNGFEIEGRVAQQDFDALYREGTPNYLQLLGARLVSGRLPTDADHAGVDRVIVINETFQRLYWPKGDAVGKRIRYGPQSPWMTIIGVVRDLRERGAELAMKPAMYPSVLQEQRPGANQLVIRAAQGQDPIQLAGAVRETLRAIDPGIPFSQVMTLDDIIDADTAERRYLMQILTVFAGLALALAAIGVYGVLSYAVSQRVREIGVRMALGADAASITRMVAGRGLLLGAIGLAAGSVGAMFLLRLVQSVLYGVTANDPVILGSAAGILTIVAAAASGGPAWRASRVDPLTALHDD
jgi:predicted permease